MWIDTKIKLPIFRSAVIGVVRANCECEHYSQVVVLRVSKEDLLSRDYNIPDNLKQYDWLWDGIQKVLAPPQSIKFWQYVPPLPKGLEAAYRVMEKTH